MMTFRPEHPNTHRLFLAAPVPDPDLQEQCQEDWRRLLEDQAEIAETEPPPDGHSGFTAKKEGLEP